MKRKAKRQTKAQKHAALFLDLYGIVHYLVTEQRCPVLLNGKLAFVPCPGVSKEAFKQAIHRKVVNNLAAMFRQRSAIDAAMKPCDSARGHVAGTPHPGKGDEGD